MRWVVKNGNERKKKRVMRTRKTEPRVLLYIIIIIILPHAKIKTRRNLRLLIHSCFFV